MPFPSAGSFTQTKWLAFFAELTAKLTHHNVLVVMEGAELLKRLLISRVSIAAILQQGELLVRLLDTWRGCVTAECAQASSKLRDGGTTSTAATANSSAAVALNCELSFVLAESISQCIDLMWSLYADGDVYYCLLVLARAGPMLEVLVDVLQTAPPQLYGITANLLQQLLSLPLGHSEVEMAADGGESGTRLIGLDKATLAQLNKSVSLRRHVCTLVEAVQEHGALLQHTTDVLAGLLAVQQGPRCLAAVCLFNLASKRLRKFELRHGQVNGGGSPSPSVAGDSDAQDCTNDNSELNVTITGAPQPASLGTPLAKGREARRTAAAAASALDDLEEGVESSTSNAVVSAATLMSSSPKAEEPTPAAARGGSDGASPSPPPTPLSNAHDKRNSSISRVTVAADVAESVKADGNGAAARDVSAVVDAEPVRHICTVPPSLAEEALRHLAASRSHDAFFDALDWLWCLTVVDAVVVGAALTPELFSQGLSRYLKAAPRTRRDRTLFTLLLLWLGHMHSISALRRDTRRCLLDTAVCSLLPMLQAELSKDRIDGIQPHCAAQHRTTANTTDVTSTAAARRAPSTTASLNVSAITPTDPSVSGVTTSAMALAASTGYTFPCADFHSFATPAAGAGLSFTPIRPPQGNAESWNDTRADSALLCEPPNAVEATLLPYAAARKAQEAALLLRPSIQVILLAFLLNLYTGVDAAAVRQAWVCDGRVLDVAHAAACRASGIRSALLDTPSTIDGALSDEVYLDYALRSVRTDNTTVAVLGCRLMAAVLGSELRWDPMWRDAQQRSVPDAATDAGAGADVATQAEVALFTESVMPLLVHIAVNNPDVAAAAEGGAASPVHYVPANLRCTRYTSLGESSLVALDACLQYYAQSGHLHSRGGEASTTAGRGYGSQVSIEDLVRVLPALARVSHGSVHPPVRAVPYRCLLYISRRIEDVLIVLCDMPSLANAAVSCVLDYGSTSSQWEVAAAAEWLTVLVDLLAEAEASATSTVTSEATSKHEAPPPDVDTTLAGDDNTQADAKQRQRRFFLFSSPAARLQEYFHFDDSPLSRRLLTSIVTARRSNTGSAYAMSALLQLAVHLHTYTESHHRIRYAEREKKLRGAKAAATAAEEVVTQALLPAGLSSIAQWIQLLQSVTADNARLTRICAAFHRTQAKSSTQKLQAGARDTSRAAAGEAPAIDVLPRTGRTKPILKDAWARALTAAEQIALQYTFAATLFRALDRVLGHASPNSSLYGKQLSNALLCNAVAAAVTLPSPREVAVLLAMRFHAPNAFLNGDGADSAAIAAASLPFCSPVLLFGYQAVLQWACCVGAGWLRETYACCTPRARDAALTAANSTPQLLGSGGGLPSPCPAALVEELCVAAEAIMRDASACLSQRTRCQAAALLSALVEACPVAHRTILEGRGAALFSAAATLRRTPCVSGLQCRLLRQVWSAARYAASAKHSWLRDNLEALKTAVDRIQESAPAMQQIGDVLRHDGSPGRSRHGRQGQRSPMSRDAASMARDLQSFQVLTSLLTNLVACVGVENPGETPPSPLSQPTTLLTSSQRQMLCAILCDALRVAALRHCVLTALRSMSETAEGRRCFLTDISTAGDPLGRTLFGRVLALTLRIPCRWAEVGGTSPHSSAVLSPTQQQQQQRRHVARHRSLSPSAASIRSPPRTSIDACGDADTDFDAVAMVGCDICTSLLGRVHAEVERKGEMEETGSAVLAAASVAEVRTPSFLAAFLKHRGLDYLAKAIVSCDQQRRRQGRQLVVPLNLLRLLAALSLQSLAAKEIVKSVDLFSVLLELAGAAFPPHATTATLALLTLRNLCFDAGLKSTFCQDARVLLTLKAAALKLSCVSQLVEEVPISAARSVGNSPKFGTAAAGAHTSAPSNPGGGRPKRVEVTLRSDVVDPDNPTAVTWAKQMCVYARARRNEAATRAASPENKEAATTGRRAVFGETTHGALRPTSDLSAISADERDSSMETTRGHEMATDAEVGRRQYLAATALASLWFDNQRGKATIAATLSVAPVCDMDEVQVLARA